MILKSTRMSSISSWLQLYHPQRKHHILMLLVCLFGAAISLSLLPLVAAEPTTAATDLKKNTFLLLCLTDGSIYSLEAWTGDFQSVIYTDPLLQTNHHPDESSISDSNVIWPGLDGRLYWRPPVAVAASSSSSSSGVDSKDDSMHGRLPPRTPQLPPLQELPLTVSTLLENPVRSCDPDNHRDCGILTAQAVTSLLALSESGDLLWQSTGGGTESPPLSENSPGASILLQRKDYWVSNVRAESGRQSWNVSMGTYQALDFDLTSAEKENEYLLGNDDILNNKHNQQPLLPAIVFGNAGKTLTAVDPVTEAVLWRQDVPSTLAAVFGIHRGQWKTVQVLEDSETIAMSESPFLPVRRQLEGAAKDTTIISEYEQFLWHSQQQQQQNHWAPNRQELEPQTNRLTNQKALPGRTYTALEQQLDRANMCYVNGMKLEGSSCPNLNLPLPLGLPAPPAAVSEPTPPLVLPLEGLLLSWSLVTALVVVLMILTVGGLWYFREKITPAANGNAVQSSRRWHDCLSSAASEELTTTQMKRSNSLPGTLGGLRPETLPLKPVLRLQRSDDGSLILAKQKEQAVVNSSKPEESPKLTKQQQQQRQVVADFSSGIPIVHYPRYASEFQQLRALGKGGFGSVFQCKNTLDGRNYAVKKVTVRGSSYDGAFKQKMDRVLREVKILAVLDHPNIVRYYAAWVEHIDDQANDGHTSEHYEDTYTYDSESMSQLCRDNFSSSDGEPSRLVHGGNRLSNHRHHETDNNPLGWNRGVDSSEELSSLPRRRSLLSKDVLTIFEESNEDREPSCADARKISYTALRSNNIDTISRRPLMDDEHSLSDRSITVAESLQTSPPRIQRNDRTAVTKHILFIQMQLCSQKTVAEFLTDLESRRGPITDTTVDIPKALRLFLQIAEAVKHVHGHGLIHRDLKPSNCFMDNSCSTVKVGDFGLSRESSSDEKMAQKTEIVQVQKRRDTREDHTAGVGTRSYASPEQMNGSDYDSSTDVYSLGIMLFELLYPMSTSMERQKCLSRLRERTVPEDWENAVGKAFPSMQDLLICMLSGNPSDRPTADSVARHVQNVLGEFTILSLDKHHYNNIPDMVLLRIEAEHRDNALQHTMQLIRDESIAADAPVDIVQYGMRSSSTSAAGNDKPAAIMEFALRYSSSVAEGRASHHRSASDLVRKLEGRAEIYTARQVSGASSTQS